jgi:HAD superfamily hydrolase (TIGR01509 family)
VEQAVRLVGTALGTDLVSMALYGSAMTTGLRPDSSDIDLLVVAARRLRRGDRRRLVTGLLQVSGRSHDVPGDRRPLELTVLALPEIRPWRFPPRFELQYGEWLRADLAAGRDAAGPVVNPDVAILIETARAASETLAGEGLQSVLPQVPWPDLVAAMAHGIEDVLPGIRENTDTTNGLLTLARINATGETRRIHGKAEAADLVLAAWSGLGATDPSPLHRARDEYLSGRYEPWDPAAHAAAVGVGEALAAEARLRLSARPDAAGYRRPMTDVRHALPRPEAVLFDLDGTLVDTVERRIEAWAGTFAEAGLPVERAVLGPLIGIDGRRLAREVAARSGVALDDARAEAIDKRCGELYEALNVDPRPLPGVRAVIAAIEGQGIAWAIATSSRREQVGTNVKALGLATEPRIVDGSHVEHAKPEPDLLLLAARELNVDPARCWYVGDSTWDIAAAIAAGMVPIGVTVGSAVSAEVLHGAGAALVVETLVDLVGRALSLGE